MELERVYHQKVPQYVRLSVPGGRPPLPLLIALHGYGGDMISMMRIAVRIARDDLIVAAVQGPHQFWVPSGDRRDARKVGFGWLTSYKAEESQKLHHRLIRNLIEDLGDEHGADTSRVFLMGFSQACALNYRLAFTHPGLLRGVIGVCGGIPGDFEDPKYRSIPAGVLHIAATEDEYYGLDRTRRFEGALSRLSGDVSYREYASRHVFPRRAIPHIRKWILDRC